MPFLAVDPTAMFGSSRDGNDEMNTSGGSTKSNCQINDDELQSMPLNTENMENTDIKYFYYLLLK